MKFQVTWQFLICRMIFLSHTPSTLRGLLEERALPWEKLLMHTSLPISSDTTIYQAVLNKNQLDLRVLTTPAAFPCKESSIFYHCSCLVYYRYSLQSWERGTTAHYLQPRFRCLITVFPEKWALHQVSKLRRATVASLWQKTAPKKKNKRLKELIPSIYVKLLYSHRSQ